jgi:hypothetical protein
MRPLSRFFHSLLVQLHQEGFATPIERIIFMEQFSHSGPQLPAALLEALQKPFAPKQVQLRPGQTQQKQEDGTWFCQALPYVSCEVYEARLNEIVPGGWSTTSPSLVVADDHLTISAVVQIGTIKHTGYGEVGVPRPSRPDTFSHLTACAPEAFAQAFIDACHRFGLGRYLAVLSRTWVPYDPQHSRLLLSTEAQHDLILQLYSSAGLTTTTEIASPPATKPSAPIAQLSEEEAQKRLRQRDLAWVNEQCAARPGSLPRILANWRVSHLEELTDGQLADVRASITKALGKQAKAS